MSNVKKFVTQKDIALACNVSRSTVAAIIRNGREAKMMPEETRNMVMAAIHKMGYRPNAAARSLTTGRTHTIALAVQQFVILDGPITSRILWGIGEEAMALSYSLTLCNYQTQPDLKASFNTLLRESRFDGVFFYGAEGFEQDAREDVIKYFGRPYVVLEKYSAKSPCVVFDNRAGGKMATEHLLEHGKKRIAYFGASGSSGLFGPRYTGYLDALEAAGIQKNEALIFPISDDYRAVGYQGVQALIQKKVPFDAVVCATDMTALSAIQALVGHGLRVPEDIAITGYDDSTMAGLANPPLTSIHQDGVEMGRQAMRLLNDLILGKKKMESKPCIIPVHPVIRRSCGCEYEMRNS